MSISQMILDGSIVFVEPNVPDPSGLDDFDAVDDSFPGVSEIISALEVLWGSATIRNTLATLSSVDPLWIQISPIPNTAQGGVFPAGLGVHGLVIISEFQNDGGFINNNGNVENFGLVRTLAHEMSHAVDGDFDTVQDLSGTTNANPDYKGDAVRYENIVASELEIGGDRVSYSGAGVFDLVGNPLDGNVLIPTMWTSGEEIDTVLIAKLDNANPDGSIIATQPGLNVDTRLNTTLLRDLIIADDSEGLENVIHSGDGRDFIYAASGNDTVFAGDGNDVLFGGAGADELRGGAGDDLLVIDLDDVVIEGGVGRDAAIMQTDETSYTFDIDLNANELETYVGGVGVDRVSATHNPDNIMILAGGDGDDELSYLAPDVSGPPFPPRPAGPAVLFGGAGADDFYIEGYSSILVLDTNLSETNIADLTFENLQSIGLDLNWDEIEVVLINPDAQDEIFLQHRDFTTDTDVFVQLDVGNHGYFDPNYTAKPYESFFSPNFTSGDAAMGNTPSQHYVYNVQLEDVAPSLGQPLGSGLTAQGNWGGEVDGIPYPDINGSDYLIPRFGWFMIGASMSGTTIGPASEPRINFGTDGDDTLDGGVGDDRLISSGGNNTYNGGGGINTIVYAGLAGSAVIDLATGSGSATLNDASVFATDTYSDVQNVIGSSGNDSITGSSASNTLSGEGGIDTIDGGGGDDIISGGNLNDMLSGGDGADLFRFADGDDVDTITDFDIAEDIVEVNGVEIDPSAPVGVTITQSGADVLIDYNSSDQIILQNILLSDWIQAGGLTVLGTSGKDDLYGGIGNDTLDGLGNNDRIYGGDGDDIITDSSGNNKFHGQAGNDTLISLSGNDYLDGGIGQDLLTGGGGRNDFAFGDGDGQDVITDFSIVHDSVRINGVEYVGPDSAPVGVSFTQSGADVIVGYGTSDTILIQNVLIDEWREYVKMHIQGTENGETIVGRANDDILYGNGGDDTLSGLGGKDNLYGGDGNDTLDGGGNNDKLYGGDGDDTLDGGSSNDKLYGGNGDDTLHDISGRNSYYGQAGNDVITGGGGNDYFTGGEDNDLITGGGGNDTFIFHDNFGNDTITDFYVNSASEWLDLRSVSEITDWADLSANHMSQSGNDVLIDDGLGNTITLENELLTDFTSSDFLF